MNQMQYTLGIDIGSTTVKIAILDENHQILFSDYKRHFANIQETLSDLLKDAYTKLGNITLHPMITGSGGLTLANYLQVPFVQEVIAVSTSLQELAPKTDVAIELGGEDAKIIYFENGNVEQRMNGICAGGTGSFIDQMASLLQTDAAGLNEYAKSYRSLYTIAARCGVFAKSDIQPLINDGATKEDLSASIFQAVVNQTISGLACGKPIRGHVAFLGGPLHFLSELKKAFIRTLNPFSDFFFQFSGSVPILFRQEILILNLFQHSTVDPSPVFVSRNICQIIRSHIRCITVIIQINIFCQEFFQFIKIQIHVIFLTCRITCLLDNLIYLFNITFII